MSTTPAAMRPNCPVCDSPDPRDLYQVKGYTISRCGTCDLTFVRDVVTLRQLEEHYAGTSEEYVYRSDDNVQLLKRQYARLRDILERLRPNRGSLLDIGCSAGHFLSIMQGWKRHGTEIVREVAAIAGRISGGEIHAGPFETYPGLPGSFDVITLQDVFDHFIDPKANLERCRELLKPGGLIVIKVHNIGCLYAKLSGKRFYAILPPDHLYYYNERSLGYLLRQGGFQVRETAFIPHYLQIKTVFYRLAQGNERSLAFRIFKRLEHTSLGNMHIRKNLHDVITIIAVKE
jgi:SAM-dependent methyltransferase